MAGLILCAVAQERLQQFLMRTGDDVRTDKFADLGGGLRAGVHGGFDAANVPWARTVISPPPITMVLIKRDIGRLTIASLASTLST